MVNPEPPLTGVYRFSSIARPVDPAFPTNRALLILLPLLAVANALLAMAGIISATWPAAAISAALTGFIAWALARELAPDDDVAAFVALVLAWAASIYSGHSSVLLPAVALLLVRIVNRTTGLPARPLDTLAILGLCIWVSIDQEQSLILLVAAIAFSLDAALIDPLRRHFLAAGVCAAVFVGLLVNGTTPTVSDLATRDWLLVLLAAAAIALIIGGNREPVSPCDVSPRRLDGVRVNAGLVLGLLIAVAVLIANGPSAWFDTALWSCIVAVAVSRAARSVLRRMF
jgi:hypothetical protein